MTKVNVLYEIKQDYLLDEKNSEYKIKIYHEKEKNIKISGKLFDLMKSEGFIQKVDNGYVFIGKREDLIDYDKKKKP